MSLNHITDEDLKRYLLCNMPQPARAALEEHYLFDDETYERLLAIEEELIDQRAHGLLPLSQWEAFRRHLMLSEHAPQRLAFARALAQFHLQRRQTGRLAHIVRQWTQRRALVHSVGGAMILFAVAILCWDLGSNSHTVPGRSVHDRTSAAIAGRVLHLDRPPSPAVTLFLSPTSRGESAGNVLRIPRGDNRIVLEAEFPGDEAKSYRGIIQRVDGGPIRMASKLKKSRVQPGVVHVSADFAAEHLNEGDYIFTVFLEMGDRSSEEINAYTLSVIRAPSS